MAQSPPFTTQRFVILASAAVAGLVAQKLVALAWKSASGHKPPLWDQDSGEARGSEIIVAAAVSGAVMGLARAAAARVAARATHQLSDAPADI